MKEKRKVKKSEKGGKQMNILTYRQTYQRIYRRGDAVKKKKKKN